MARLNGPRNGRDPARDRIALATVDLVGEHGLQAVAVESICERADVNRSHFNRCFADLEDCFLSLHEEVATDFWQHLLPAAEGAVGWHDRIWAAGWAMMRFLQRTQCGARFLFVAVNGAGGEALVRRDRFVQRFADLLDGGHTENGKPGRISRCTAEIAAGAIYRMVLMKVEAGAIERDEEFLPELIYIAVMPYLGSQVAEDELAVQPLH